MTAVPPLSDSAEKDRALMQRARRGDRHAFDVLYARHVRPVYWQAYSIVGNASDAEDATQDVFITAWRKLGMIEVVDDSLLPWLLVTARFVALNSRRKRLRRDRRMQQIDESVADGEALIEDAAEQRTVMARVDQCVAGLSDNDRRLYELCIEGDKTYGQAAAALGVSHAAVRNRLSRVRQRLRADLSLQKGAL